MSNLLKLYLGTITPNMDNMKDMTDLMDTYDSAKQEFDKTLLKRLMKMEYEAECLGEKYIKIKAYENTLRETKKELTAKEHNNGYCFITINPKPDVSLDTFKKQVEKAVNRNMFVQVRYVYEQRGTNMDEAGKGFHTHILAKRNLSYKPNKVAANLKNTFKGVVDVNNPSLLNIQHIGADFAKDKDEYIDGVKTGEGKDLKQEIDVEWRKSNGLSVIYGEKII